MGHFWGSSCTMYPTVWRHLLYKPLNCWKCGLRAQGKRNWKTSELILLVRQKLSFQCLLGVTATSTHNKTVKIMQRHSSHTVHIWCFLKLAAIFSDYSVSSAEEKRLSLATYGLELLRSLLGFFNKKCPFFTGSTSS